MTGSTDWAPRVRQLAQALIDAGLLDRPWREAFTQTPRHVFVPRFYRNDDTIMDGDDLDTRKEWLDAVYSDTSLVTRQLIAPGTNLMWSTSSSTRPSLMAHMLRLLDVADDHRVAEIGTGTGYNAALLCHRLGDQRVASVDIDPELVENARTALATLGYHPYLTAGDGRHGIPDRMPYDRLIATCAVPAIPPAWIQQLGPGGILVADLRGEVASSLFTGRKTDPGTVLGRFHTTPGHFMWLRTEAANPLRDGGTWPTSVSRDGQQTTKTRLDPVLFDDPDLRFLLQTRQPDLSYLWHTTTDDRPVLAIATTVGGWVEIDTNQHPDGILHVNHGGPDSLWDTIEDTVQLWLRLGRPTRDRFGLTVHTDAGQRLWLDNPDQPVPPHHQPDRR